MNSYYTGITVLSVFGMVVMSFMVLINHTLSHLNKRRFIISFVLTMVGALFEWGAYSLSFTDSPVWLHTFVKTMELIVAPTIPLAIVSAISDKRRYVKIMVGIATANTVIEVLSAFFGFVFYVDAANVYHHGPLYFLYITFYMVQAFGLFFVTIVAMRSYQGRKMPILILAILYMMTGLAMQMIDSSIRVDYITITIALMFFYIVHEDIIRSSDSLTKMLNRHSYDTKISNLAENTLIINIDIDYFKQCNDSYGHLFGDEVLKVTSEVIRASLPAGGLGYRTGGDEFCVMIAGCGTDPEEYLVSLHEAMAQRRTTMPSLPFISTGYACFRPGEESVFDALERADTMMYKYKGLRKKLLKEGITPTFPELQEILRNTPLNTVKKR
ncbi:MAG: GGDEF domain-containing protein [Spirochaetales bacterium]|nr:GGDEF domain-containing protein [Spirochaetales bacterium]